MIQTGLPGLSLAIFSRLLFHQERPLGYSLVFSVYLTLDPIEGLFASSVLPDPLQWHRPDLKPKEEPEMLGCMRMPVIYSWLPRMVFQRALEASEVFDVCRVAD